MDRERIREKIKDYQPSPAGVESNCAVLLPLLEIENRAHLVFEVRADRLNTQPGEISFPGGRVEPGESYREAALRETCEELNLTREVINIFGSLDYIITPYNIAIYPFTGYIDGKDDNIIPSRAEVKEIFTVPLSFFMNNEPEVYKVTTQQKTGENFPYHLIPGGRNYAWRTGEYPVYFYRYGDRIIWGFTARITKNFVDIIK